MLVARHQLHNPEGWLLLGLAVAGIALVDCGLYSVLDYHMHHSRLPLGELAVVLRGTIGPPLIFLSALVILLFPDGRLTRRWKWVLWAYLVVVAVVTAGFGANEAGTVAGQRIQVNVNGSYSGPGGPAGFLGAFAAVAGLGFILVPLFWPASVTRQALSWRRATGDRRQQLKSLTSGAITALTGLALIAVGPPNDQLSGRMVRDIAFLALAVLPVTIGVGILKYHLYDIDRIISRTLAYAIVTSLLAGVYTGVVPLATRVLPLSSPVAVAGATWPPRRCSARCGAGCSGRWTAGSTGPATTPTRPSPRSRPGCRTPWTWTRSAMTWPVWCGRPWSPLMSRCG